MKQFAEMFDALDRTNKTNEKTAVLTQYFRTAEPGDAAWAIHVLSGRRLKRVLPTALLREWARESAGIEPWMMEECYEAVGDLAETISLILPESREGHFELTLRGVVETLLIPLSSLPVEQQRASVLGAWSAMSRVERLIFNKLITGSFRIGVSQKLIVRALSEAYGVEQDVLSHRLMGDWQPSEAFIDRLSAADTCDAENSRPYPFFLAQALDSPVQDLGNPEDWQAEWKWDGIRAQIILRHGQPYIWSRGEELMTDRFPELSSSAKRLPDGTVLDGEVVAMRYGTILPFSEVQRRIGRKNLTKKILNEVPVRFLAFDLLEIGGVDFRPRPLSERRTALGQIISQLQSQESESTLQLPPVVEAADWEGLQRQRDRCRDVRAEGLMLKLRSSPYRIGRPRGEWWKWKIEPYTVDAVLIYAQRGHGRRAGLYTDYTFAVWDQEQLVPFAKAYSGLTDDEIRIVDQFIRTHTLERFGPVRSVTPELVFELAFENIQISTRHKSGIAVRFPRILRRREDKKPEDADSLETIRGMLDGQRAS